MLIIFTLIAAFVLLVLRLIALVYNESKRNLTTIENDTNKVFTATFLEPLDIPGEDVDAFVCEHPLAEYRAGCN